MNAWPLCAAFVSSQVFVAFVLWLRRHRYDEIQGAREHANRLADAQKASTIRLAEGHATLIEKLSERIGALESRVM